MMLYAYKRRLLRGFLKFLNLEHDKGRRKSFSVNYDVLLDGGGRSSISATVKVSPSGAFPLSRNVCHGDPRVPHLQMTILSEI